MRNVSIFAAMLLSAVIFSNKCIAQQNQSAGGVLPNFSTATPPQITNEIFRFRPGLATHLLNGALPTGSGTIGFDATDRWLSFGQVTATTQNVFGFRTQSNGRGLAMGYSVPNAGQPSAGVNSNPFIEWIGNNTLLQSSDPASPQYTPGNLEFRYALSPTGASAARVPIFIMAPSTTNTANTSNSYAQNGLLGHYENTSPINTPASTFGTFGIKDKWIGIGNPPVPGSPLYGMRTYWNGFSLNSAVREDAGQKNAIIEWGGDQATISGLNTSEMKFRYFADNTNPAGATQILAFRPTGTSYFGGAISNNFTTPFVEINALRKFTTEGLAVNLQAVPAASIQSGIKVRALQLLGSLNTLYGLNSLAQNGGTNYGVNSLALDGNTNYGVFARAESSHDNYGIYSEVVGGNNNIAGYFNGAVVTTSGFYNISDKSFKKDIQKETSVLERVNKINVVTYLMDKEKFPTLNLSDKINHGFIAQELEEVFPELVKDVKHPIFKKGEMVDKVELKAVNYIEIIPVLTKAIQELSEKIETLETQLKSSSTANTLVLTNKTNLPAEIENKAFSLSQNTPNPFSDKTTISYTIPSNVNKATLVVFDMTGKLLLQYRLQSGKNNLVINGNTLQAGMYLYSLLADGQEVISKRMVLTK